MYSSLSDLFVSYEENKVFRGRIQNTSFSFKLSQSVRPRQAFPAQSNITLQISGPIRKLLRIVLNMPLKFILVLGHLVNLLIRQLHKKNLNGQLDNFTVHYFMTNLGHFVLTQLFLKSKQVSCEWHFLMRGITQNDSNNLSALKMGTIHPIKHFVFLLEISG